jgi:imidazolonepropionase
MLIVHASQLLTLAGGPQRGSDLGHLGIIEDGAVLVREGLILETGETADLLARYPREDRLDAQNKVVMPGFVDPHTHAVWAGDRVSEFEMCLEGRSYMEILAAGGGIQATVQATRSASPDDLTAQTRSRTQTMFRNGTTTAEVKTGYGLETSCELVQLQTILRLNQEGPIELVPTLMPAHAIPPEFKANPGGYVDLVVSEMLPFMKGWMQEHASHLPLPFVDVFCEQGIFDLAQTRQILIAARELGFPLKLHVDEFANLGGATLAAEMSAASADHLVKTSADDIRILSDSKTAAVALPCTPFGLSSREYTPAKEILAAGGLLALATDLNPGTAWCENMQFVIALSCRYLGLTPSQAVAAATINAAAAIQREDRVGSIEPGKQADLLILSVNDFRHLAYRFGSNLVQTVIKKGRVYSHTSTQP